MSDDEKDNENILSRFDSLCVSFGEEDAIVRLPSNASTQKEGSESESPSLLEVVSYMELQLLSQILACQLHFRFRPDFVLMDCFGHAAAEAVAIFACLRLQIPFIPVSVEEGVGPQGRLQSIVNTLRQTISNTRTSNRLDILVVAVTCVANDVDPRLGMFYQAGVHNILYMDATGNLTEQIPVPQLPSPLLDKHKKKQNQMKLSAGNGDSCSKNTNTTCNILDNDDALYVLFTSGTSGNQPKAVVGSHRSTFNRLAWFRDTFTDNNSSSSSQRQRQRIARRTPLTFVDGVNELLGALLTERAILIAAAQPKELLATGVAFFFRNNVNEDVDFDYIPTQITMLPSQLEQFLLFIAADSNSEDSNSKHQLLRTAGLERIIVSGELFSKRLYHTVRQQLPHCQILNLYGQTETTGDVLCAVLSDLPESVAVVNGVVAVGWPILPSISVKCIIIATQKVDAPLEDDGRDTSLDTVGQQQQQQGDAAQGGIESGELVISGNQSLGYLFVDGGEDGNIMSCEPFATGDVGFCVKNGTSTDAEQEQPIWYVTGRKDDVEKINGVWTSPSEVEAAFAKAYPEANRVAATIVSGNVYCVVVLPDKNMQHWEFQRDHMRQLGLPWNLIPRKVFIRHEIPTSRTGAGKTDRTGLKLLVRELLEAYSCSRKDHSQKAASSTITACSSTDSGHVLVESITKVLNLVVVDESKSFANLGGNSASAVTLLYHLRIVLQTQLPEDFTAVDILQADHVAELKTFIREGKRQKRRKLDGNGVPSLPFHPEPTHTVSDTHQFLQFSACVDASPVSAASLSSKSSFFVGCQGGVVQKISSNTDISQRLVCSHHFSGWMIQADVLFVSDDSVVVCAYNRAGRGMIASLALDLQDIKWRVEIGESIKSSPILVNGQIQVQTGRQIRRFDALSGNEQEAGGAAINLPAVVTTKPAVVAGAAVYLSADYECDQLLVLENSSVTVSMITPDCNAIGPVTKDPLVVDEKNILVADSWGSLHLINTTTWEGVSLHVASSPLGPPAMMQTKDTFLVGSYDGCLHSVHLQKGDGPDKLLVVQWTLNVGATIYTKPLVLPGVLLDSSSCSAIVCTTAGDVVWVQDGNVTRKYCVVAEIWSDPVLIKWENDTFTVAFGARDSRVHMVSFNR